MLLEHHVPLIQRLAVLVGLAKPAVHEGRALLTLAVHVDPRIEGILSTEITLR